MRNQRPTIVYFSIPYFSIVVLTVISLLSSCASSTGNEQPEANFGFTLEYGSCSIDKLDTFKGEFIQGRVVEPDLTIPMELSINQMRRIYEGMAEIDLVSYPDAFKVPEPLFGEVVRISSPFYYALFLENGHTKISIRWLDDLVKPTTPKADRLRGWFDGIIKMIREHPAYQQLPKVNFGCI